MTGFVSIGGNYYSVPDRTRRIVEVHQLPDLIRILDEGRLVAASVLEGRGANTGSTPAIGRARPQGRCGSVRGHQVTIWAARAIASPAVAGLLSGHRRRLARRRAGGGRS